MSVDEQFYPLTHSVLDKLMDAKLTAAEWKLWAYLTKLDSWGDRYVDLPDTLTVMQELGISKATYYRAIAKLQKLELFDFQDKGFAVRNLTCRKSKKLVSKMRLDSQKCETSLKNETEKSEMRQLSQKRENQSLESSQSQDSDLPQTYSDYSNFIQTLSESEREQFEKFVRIEWKKLTTKNGELGEEIVSLERFLSRAEDIKNWYQRFLNSPAGEEVKKSEVASIDWTQHPEWSDWLAIMREGVPRFVALGTCFDHKTRRAIADWADERGLIWGTES